MDINLPRIFSPWGTGEVERVVASGFSEEKDTKPYIERIAKILPQKQFETGNFYDLKVVDVCVKERQMAEGHRKERQAKIERFDLIVFRVTLVSSIVLFGVTYLSKGHRQKVLFCGALAIPLVVYPLLKRYGRSYYPEKTFHYERENTPYDLVLFRKEVNRTLPSNFDIEQDRDPITLEFFTEERLQSPEVIYLPNYVVSSKEFVRSSLEKGMIRHTLDNRDFSTEELKAIVDQISQIFRISPVKFWSCFDLASAEERDQLDERGLDSEGKYTDEAKDAIAYSFSGIRDSGLPEIDELIDHFEVRMSRSLEALRDNLGLQTYFSQPLKQTSINLDEIYALVFNLGFSPISMASLRMGEEDQTISFPIFTIRILVMTFLKNHGPEWYRDCVSRHLDEEKEKTRRDTRLKILSATLFNRDMRKSDRKLARIERFEALTGISFSETAETEDWLLG